MILFEVCCLLLLPTGRGFSSFPRFGDRPAHKVPSSAARQRAFALHSAAAEFSQEGSAASEKSIENEEDEEILLHELTSPEMALGMSTLSEKSTMDTVLALSRVGAATRVEESLLDVTNATVTTASVEDSSLDLTKTERERSIEAPSVARIIRFALGAVVVWLCSPILSLIDTSVVGLCSGTAQQAALNPAVAIVEYTALLIAFMYTATTNLIALAQSVDHGKEEMPRTTKSFITALKLSGFVGGALGIALFGLSVPLLKAIIGSNSSVDAEVFVAALKYVRIRALGMPAAAIIGSSQAACLGMQDIKSPLYVLIAAAVVNFFGDIMFVGNTNPWIGGAAGAAWATVASQFVAVALFVQWLCHVPSQEDSRTRRLRLFPMRFNKYSTRGFLKGKFRGRDFFKLPSREQVADFTPYIIPVTSTQVGRVSSYLAMSHVIASSLGTVNMAAQQVIISVWNCLYPVGESLSLTAQSFTPGIFEKKPSPARTQALRRTLSNFWKAGLVLGAGLFGAVLCIPLLCQFFTADPAVVSLVHSVLPLLLVIFSTLGIFTASEGMILGQRDLGFLGKSYATFFVVIPYLMLRLKRAALRGTAVVTLKSVWTVFTSYQLFRTGFWMMRALQLQRRAHRSSQEAS